MLDSAYWSAILLGVVQGIAEFLPISSSGHLVIAGALLKEAGRMQSELEHNLQLNVALHAGTLGSIAVVYFRELLATARDFRRCMLVGVATLPLVVLGLLPDVRHAIEELFQSPLVAGCGLLVTSVLLTAGWRLERDRDELSQLSPLNALAVGLFQSVAVIPGISRSGSTISAGLLVGLRRNAATEFSFLIAVPAIGGATLLTIKDVLEAPAASPSANSPGVLLAGALTAFLVGIVSLRWLLKLVTMRRLHWFAVYCFVAGCATIVWQLAARGGG
ncbi:MAG: undecaprenyl-diphosphate phosphatase [Planctomycetaceae bacterium]|nr:undecaprenyl-diphosphate phosphatase [Planctomycetaceae bacterium]